MNVCTRDDGFRMSHRHQHQHQRVVSHAVGRVGDGFDGDADAFRVVHVDVVVSDASRGDVRYAGFAEREKRGVRDFRLVTDADASVPECQSNVAFRYRCLGDRWHDAKARRHLAEQGGLVLFAPIDRDSHCWDGRGGRGRRRSGAAGRGSCWFAADHVSIQGSGVLPARMWFSICRRYAPAGVASPGWPAPRRPAVPDVLGASGGAAFGARRSTSCLAAYSPALIRLSPRCPSTTPISDWLPLSVGHTARNIKQPPAASSDPVFIPTNPSWPSRTLVLVTSPATGSR